MKIKQYGNRKKYEVDPQTGCHLWHGAKNGQPLCLYGVLKIDGRQVKAHKYFYELKYGPVPDGMELDHIICSNSLCVNPDHVKAVTHAQNVARAFT